MKNNKYILCYRSEKGKRPCKTYFGEYITGCKDDKLDLILERKKYNEKM
ncbi:hypothetical protein [Spiroplasma citri]|nr:hypothetical protein [Spiroplasma citri]